MPLYYDGVPQSHRKNNFVKFDLFVINGLCRWLFFSRLQGKCWRRPKNWHWHCMINNQQGWYSCLVIKLLLPNFDSSRVFAAIFMVQIREVVFLVVFLTPYNEHMRPETYFTQEKGNALNIICKRPAPPNYNLPVPPGDHLKPQKRHEKWIFETLHNEIKYVLSIKESNFNGKNGSKFSHLLTVRAEGAREVVKKTDILRSGWPYGEGGSAL